jgi:hypothetical protein
MSRKMSQHFVSWYKCLSKNRVIELDSNGGCCYAIILRFFFTNKYAFSKFIMKEQKTKLTCCKKSINFTAYDNCERNTTQKAVCPRLECAFYFVFKLFIQLNCSTTSVSKALKIFFFSFFRYVLQEPSIIKSLSKFRKYTQNQALL